MKQHHAKSIMRGLVSLGLFVATCAGPGAAAELIVDATQWITKGDRHMRGESNQMDATMHVVTPRWERTYVLRSWMQGIDKTFVRVLEPSKVKGQGYLNLATRLWQYLPSAERTVLIPPSLMLEDFLGSDFSNDDFVKQSYLPRDYTHQFVSLETIEGTPTRLFELLPKPEAPVVYGKLRLWLRASDAAFVKVEFYNEKLAHIRTLTYSDFRRFNDREYPTRWSMVNEVEPGRRTTVTVNDATFNLPIDAAIFTRQHLEADDS